MIVAARKITFVLLTLCYISVVSFAPSVTLTKFPRKVNTHEKAFCKNTANTSYFLSLLAKLRKHIVSKTNTQIFFYAVLVSNNFNKLETSHSAFNSHDTFHCSHKVPLLHKPRDPPRFNAA